MKKFGLLCFLLLLLLPLRFAEAGHYHNGLFFYDDANNYLRITHYSGSGVASFADLTSATKVQTNDSDIIFVACAYEWSKSELVLNANGYFYVWKKPNGTYYIKHEDTADYTGDYYRLPEVLGREAQYIESRAYGNMHNRK